MNHDHPYGEIASTLQVDIVAYNQITNVLTAVEVKRGYSTHDAGKKKSILKNALAVQMLLKGYGKEQLGSMEIRSTKSRICNYYKSQEFHPAIMIDKDQLDEFFNVSIYNMVEEVNNYFRKEIHALMGLEAN